MSSNASSSENENVMEVYKEAGSNVKEGGVPARSWCSVDADTRL